MRGSWGESLNICLLLYYLKFSARLDAIIHRIGMTVNIRTNNIITQILGSTRAFVSARTYFFNVLGFSALHARAFTRTNSFIILLFIFTVPESYNIIVYIVDYSPFSVRDSMLRKLLK